MAQEAHRRSAQLGCGASLRRRGEPGPQQEQEQVRLLPLWWAEPAEEAEEEEEEEEEEWPY